MRRLLRSNQGFTILELMVATAVFSVILLIVAAGVIDFTHQYYKGITSGNTETVARDITNQIAQGLQFNSSFQQPDSSVPYYCIGGDVYSAAIGTEVKTGGEHGLVETQTTCDSATETADYLFTHNSGARELLSPNMRLANLDIEGPNNNLYTVTVKVIYGDNDLLNLPTSGLPVWNNIQCTGGQGDDFCAVSSMSTTVQQRVPPSSD